MLNVNIYIQPILLLHILYVHVQIFKYINLFSTVILSHIHIFPTFCHHCIYSYTLKSINSTVNSNNVSYSHFPHVLSPLCIYSYTLNSINCNVNCNIFPYSHFPHVLSPLYIQLHTEHY